MRVHSGASRTDPSVSLRHEQHAQAKSWIAKWIKMVHLWHLWFEFGVLDLVLQFQDLEAMSLGPHFEKE